MEGGQQRARCAATSLSAMDLALQFYDDHSNSNEETVSRKGIHCMNSMLQKSLQTKVVANTFS
jgi:hypothetical protein